MDQASIGAIRGVPQIRIRDFFPNRTGKSEDTFLGSQAVGMDLQPF